ncbi:hypothetical protein PFISCL1PPCAC_7747, partial [Pristionchus fissidentatus]
FGRPEIHDWIQQNIYICDLDPSFGRTRFLTREEASIFRCQCGDPSRTGLACAQHLEQRPFCSRLPSTCLDEWRIQFGGRHATFPTLAPSTLFHRFPPPTPSPSALSQQSFRDDRRQKQPNPFRVPEFAAQPPREPVVS